MELIRICLHLLCKKFASELDANLQLVPMFMGIYCTFTVWCHCAMQYHLTLVKLSMQYKPQCVPEMYDSVTTKLGKVNLWSELYQMVRPQCRSLCKPCGDDMTNTYRYKAPPLGPGRAY